MKKLIHDFEVLQRNELNTEHFVLDIKATEPLPLILPGQFVNLLLQNSGHTFLRRPFSVHFVDYQKNTVQLFIKRVGKGTHSLGKIKPKEKLNVIYPLGNSYSIPKQAKTLLIGGGCGIAPLLYLAKFLHDAENQITTILGAISGNDIVEIEKFRQFSNTLITTEDGTMGERGYPTQHSILKQEQFEYIFTCGPLPMMKAVASYACKKNIPCEVSLESSMACGFGACLCCVTKTKKGHKCVCTEGPVFNTNDLTW